MTDLNKSKLHVILTVTVTFTFITAIKDNHWVGYVLTLLVFPLITWGVLELMIKFKKDITGDMKTIVRKGMPLYVKEIRVGELDKTKCSPKFLTHNLPDDTIVNVKCHEDGTLDLRGKKGEYRIIMEDKIKNGGI
jgi:hypothetical protein